MKSENAAAAGSLAAVSIVPASLPLAALIRCEIEACAGTELGEITDIGLSATFVSLRPPPNYITLSI